jgi:hypothetical protein
MKKSINLLFPFLLLFLFSTSVPGQSVEIGPRLTANLNIYNQDGLTGTWNGFGVGIGGVLDISFSRTLGLMTNLTIFDMKNFSNETTNNNVTTENSLSLSYLTVDPLFKAEFSGFYLVGGASFAIKLSSSGERTTSATGQNPQVTTLNIETNSLKFDLAAGTGYNFNLSPSMDLGADFMVYVPLTDTYDTPGLSNSTLSLKLGASLKFRIN